MHKRNDTTGCPGFLEIECDLLQPRDPAIEVTDDQRLVSTYHC